MDYQYEADEQLVIAVEKHPCLYNKSLKEYKDDSRKQNAWKLVAAEMNSDRMCLFHNVCVINNNLQGSFKLADFFCAAQTVGTRWNNLRDRFVRALQEATKPPKSGSSSDSIVNTKNIFPLYSVMLWLAPHIRKRK